MIAFGVVFSIFVVASLVLLVLVIRFTLQRASIARQRWMTDGTEGPDGGQASGEDGASSEDDEDAPRSMTALVLAGGGTRGALQIGMLQVLAEHGFVPDRIYGVSVGAINGVAFAGDPTREGVQRMTDIWLGLSRDSVYPQGRLHGPWQYVRQRDSVYPNAGLRKIIDEGIQFERLEDAPIPVEVVAASLTDGRERWFTHGSVVEPVLASAAVPAIFPPVEIEEEQYIDGGVLDNVPIQRAIDAGATRIVVLLCSPLTYTPTTPKRPAEALFNAFMISMHARFPRELAMLPPGVEVIVCAGSENAGLDFDDFSGTQALIDEGRKEASEIVRRYRLGEPDAFSRTASPSGTSETTGTNGRDVSWPDPTGEDGAVAASSVPFRSVPDTQPEPRT
jgi:NTE family protein